MSELKDKTDLFEEIEQIGEKTRAPSPGSFQVVPTMDQSTGDSEFSTTEDRQITGRILDTATEDEDKNEEVVSEASSSKRLRSPVPPLNLELGLDDVAEGMSRQALETACEELVNEDLLVKSAIEQVSTDFVSGDLSRLPDDGESDGDESPVSENGSARNYHICEPWSDQDNVGTWSGLSTPQVTPRVLTAAESQSDQEVRADPPLEPVTPKVLPIKYFTPQVNEFTPAADESIAFQSETPMNAAVKPVGHSTPFINTGIEEKPQMIALDPEPDTTITETSYEEMPDALDESTIDGISKRPETQGSEADFDEQEETVVLKELSPGGVVTKAGVSDYVPASEREKLLQRVEADEATNRLISDVLARENFKPAGASDIDSDVTDYTNMPDKMADIDPVRCTAMVVVRDGASSPSKDRSPLRKSLSPPANELNQSSCSSTQYQELPTVVGGADKSEVSALKSINDSLGDTICQEIEDFLANQEPLRKQFRLDDEDDEEYGSEDDDDTDDSVTERVKRLLLQCEAERSFTEQKITESSETLVAGSPLPKYPVRLTRSHNDISGASYERYHNSPLNLVNESIGEKVHRLLAKSDELRHETSPRASPTSIRDLVHSASAVFTDNVYHDLQRDLDEINTSLRQYRHEARKKINMSPESQASVKSMDTVKTSSDLDYEKSKKLQWDYAADIGEVSLPEFVSSVTAAKEKAEAQKVEIARSRSPLNPNDVERKSMKRLAGLDEGVSSGGVYKGTLPDRVYRLLQTDLPQQQAYNILREAEEREMEAQVRNLQEQRQRQTSPHSTLSRVSERTTPRSPRQYKPLQSPITSPSKRERTPTHFEINASPNKRTRTNDSIIDRLSFSPLAKKPFTAFQVCRDLLSDQMQKMNDRRSLDFLLTSPTKTRIEVADGRFDSSLKAGDRSYLHRIGRPKSASPNRPTELSMEVANYMVNHRSMNDMRSSLPLKGPVDRRSPVVFTDEPYSQKSFAKSMDAISREQSHSKRSIVSAPPDVTIGKIESDEEEDIPSVTPRNQQVKIVAPGDSQHVRVRQPRSTSPLIRPYKPPGSNEVFYFESNPEETSTGISGGETTQESTHLGSDDAQPPYLPPHVLGSRVDPINKSGKGIYGHRPLRTMAKVEEEKDVHGSLKSVESFSASRQEKSVETGLTGGGARLAWADEEKSETGANQERFSTPEKAKDMERRLSSHSRDSANDMMPLQLVTSSSDDDTDALRASARSKTSLQILQNILERESDSSTPDDLGSVWKMYQARKQAQRENLSIIERIQKLSELFKRPTKSYTRQKADSAVSAQSSKLSSKKDEIRAEDRAEIESESSSSVNVSPRTDSSTDSTHELRAKMNTVLDAADTLSSIPEDNVLDTLSSDTTTTTACSDLMKTNDPKVLKLRLKIIEQKEKHERGKRREEKRCEKIEKLEQVLLEKKLGQQQDTSDSSISQTTLSTTASTTTVLTSEADSSSSTLEPTKTDLTAKEICVCGGKTGKKGKLDVEKLKEIQRQERIIRKLKEARTKAEQIIEKQKSGNWYLEYDKPKKSKQEFFRDMQKTRDAKKNKRNSTKHQNEMKNKKIQANLDAESTAKSHHRSNKKHDKSDENKENRRHKPKNRDATQNCPTPIMLDTQESSSSAGQRTESVQTSTRIDSSADQGAPLSKMFSPEKIFTQRKKKNKPAPVGTDGGLCWYVPVNEHRPWKKPLSERQNLANHIPQFNIPKGPTFEDVELIKDKDPDVQFFLHKENIEDKPASVFDNEGKKISLQEALVVFKGDFVSQSRERQKRIKLASQEREIRAQYKKQRQLLFADSQKIDPNRNSHPFSDNLYKPRYRVMTKKEMKELTDKVYKRLPEVLDKKLERKRDEEYKTNRLRARIFKEKVLNQVLNRYHDI
ncbi:uncharacterized protein LOC141899517 [Tubulanus polymorphus]|uniref:uncharacterized protein LOC141899517 n=1 Tax=Tubulanus polymorphus TaxID=672921 RepID=UPI003DA5DA94